MCPFHPLKLFKDLTQFEYNTGKWGLDKFTEYCKKVQVHTKRVGFEGKYVKRMFDSAAMVNSWQCTRVRVVTQYINEHKSDPRNNGASLTEEQIHQKAYGVSLDDFVFDVSCEWLSNLEVEYVHNQHFNVSGQDIRSLLQGSTRHVRIRGTRPVSAMEQQILDTINQRKNEQKWPVSTNKAKVFTKQPELKQIRLSNDAMMTMKHGKKPFPATPTNRYKKGCAVCSKICHVSSMLYLVLYL